MIKKLPRKRTVIARCDTLARQINVLIHKNRCERCGKSGESYRLNWAHIFGRRNKSHGLRWSMDNCHLFCFRCHLWQHENPMAYEDWFTSTYGKERKERLLRAFNEVQASMSVHDYLRIEQDLKKLWQETPK